MSNEISPPPNEPPAAAKVPSEAPGVKEARIQWDAVENICAMVLATVGLFYGKVPLEWWLGIIGSAIGLSSALRAYGAKRAGMISTVAFFVLQGAARHAGLVVLLLSLLLGGCGADLSQVVQSARVPVNAMGRALERHHAVLVGLCANLPGGSPAPAQCPELVETYNDIATAQNAMQDGLDALESAQ